jgi:hypothetical protein
VHAHMKQQPIFSSSTTEILLTIAVSFLQVFPCYPVSPLFLNRPCWGGQ